MSKTVAEWVALIDKINREAGDQPLTAGEMLCRLAKEKSKKDHFHLFHKRIDWFKGLAKKENVSPVEVRGHFFDSHGFVGRRAEIPVTDVASQELYDMLINFRNKIDKMCRDGVKPEVMNAAFEEIRNDVQLIMQNLSSGEVDFDKLIALTASDPTEEKLAISSEPDVDYTGSDRRDFQFCEVFNQILSNSNIPGFYEQLFDLLSQGNSGGDRQLSTQLKLMDAIDKLEDDVVAAIYKKRSAQIKSTVPALDRNRLTAHSDTAHLFQALHRRYPDFMFQDLGLARMPAIQVQYDQRTKQVTEEKVKRARKVTEEDVRALFSLPEAKDEQLLPANLHKLIENNIKDIKKAVTAMRDAFKSERLVRDAKLRAPLDKSVGDVPIIALLPFIANDPMRSNNVFSFKREVAGLVRDLNELAARTSTSDDVAQKIKSGLSPEKHQEVLGHFRKELQEMVPKVPVVVEDRRRSSVSSTSSSA